MSIDKFMMVDVRSSWFCYLSVLGDLSNKLTHCLNCVAVLQIYGGFYIGHTVFTTCILFLWVRHALYAVD